MRGGAFLAAVLQSLDCLRLSAVSSPDSDKHRPGSGTAAIDWVRLTRISMSKRSMILPLSVLQR